MRAADQSGPLAGAGQGEQSQAGDGPAQLSAVESRGVGADPVAAQPCRRPVEFHAPLMVGSHPGHVPFPPFGGRVAFGPLQGAHAGEQDQRPAGKARYRLRLRVPGDP